MKRSKKIYIIYITNLFLLNIDKIKEKLKQLDFVSSFEIKNLSNLVSLLKFLKQPIAILYNKNDKILFE